MDQKRPFLGELVSHHKKDQDVVPIKNLFPSLRYLSFSKKVKKLMHKAKKVLTNTMHLQKWEVHWPRLASTSAPAPPNNQIDSKWRSTLESGIKGIQDMLQIRLQVKWVFYVVKRQDQLALLSQLHLNVMPSTKLSRQQTRVTQSTTSLEKEETQSETKQMKS